MQQDENCYPDKMFNPVLMKCDSISKVIFLKPNCATDPGETEPDYATGGGGPVTRKSTTVFAGEDDFSPLFFATEPTVDIVGHPNYFTLCNPRGELKVEHPESCDKYLECLQIANGSYFYTEKVCGINLMFNPKSKVCDATDEVIHVKPYCGTKNLTIESQVLETTTKSPRIIVTRPRPSKMTITPSTITIKSTATPPQHCEESSMDPLLHYLPDSSFTASSFLSKAFKPEAARLDSRPGDGSVSYSFIILKL